MTVEAIAKPAPDALRARAATLRAQADELDREADRLERRVPQTPLTPREAEVLRLLADTGGTNREIAEALGVAVRTVDVHLQNLRWKLGMNTRARLVRYALGQDYQ